ncbi:MAG: DUF1638 domain-containing protein [Alphaproteobacteria bacterium]
MARPPSTLLIACGALAWEIAELIRGNRWTHISITCVPAHFHNTPEKIPEAVREKIRAGRGKYERIVALYGDCGTGGLLDAVLAEEGVERIPGPHCYQFYAGRMDFEALMEAEPGSFFLTDYLVRHFDRLIVEGLGLDRHPELLGDYFGNYRKLVYLAQIEDSDLVTRAVQAARRLGLEFEHRNTGYGELGRFVSRIARERETVSNGEADDRLLA